MGGEARSHRLLNGHASSMEFLSWRSGYLSSLGFLSWRGSVQQEDQLAGLVDLIMSMFPLQIKIIPHLVHLASRYSARVRGNVCLRLATQ